MALDKEKIKEELKEFSEDAAEVIGDALKKHFWKSVKAAWKGFSVIQKRSEERRVGIECRSRR